MLLSAGADDQVAAKVFLFCMAGAFFLWVLITLLGRPDVYPYKDEQEMATHEAQAPVALLQLGKTERERYELELAILHFCQQKIDEILDNSVLPNRYRWELRRKFCTQFQNFLLTKSGPCTIPDLTEDQKAEVLKSHPLLAPIADSPPDPAKTFSDEDWYRDIRAKATHFAETLYSGEGDRKG